MEIREELTFLSSVQSLSRVWLFVTPWTAACQASLSITNSRNPPKPMSIESVMPSHHLILFHPLLLLPCLSQHQGLFKWVSSSHQMAKILEFQLQHNFPTHYHLGIKSGRLGRRADYFNYQCHISWIDILFQPHGQFHLTLIISHLKDLAVSLHPSSMEGRLALVESGERAGIIPWFVAFANFPGVKIPTMDNFKLQHELLNALLGRGMK